MIAVLFHRFGPYHVARLATAARTGDVVGVELSGSGGEYAWEPVVTGSFRRVTIHPPGDTNALPAYERAAKIEAALDALNPEVLAVAGYSDPGMLAATRWGLRRGKRIVLMADSQYHDEPRVWWREWVKRRLVACSSSAFVAGTTHAEYLRRLGMQADRIVVGGYDVVDNDYFARGADEARATPGLRERLALPERYFLNVARFVPNKNLSGLLTAYSIYQRACGDRAWDLVLVGDGPLSGELAAQAATLGVSASVRFLGFRQYEELPPLFGLASAFVLSSVVEQWGLVVNEAMAAGLPVLVSEICGSAPDLIKPGENGATFGVRDDRRLAELMGELTASSDRAMAMGRRGRETVAGWGLDRFADGLRCAADLAAPQRVGPLGRVILDRMAGRRVH